MGTLLWPLAARRFAPISFSVSQRFGDGALVAFPAGAPAGHLPIHIRVGDAISLDGATLTVGSAQ
jgi:hypothetical protein